MERSLAWSCYVRPAKYANITIGFSPGQCCTLANQDRTHANNRSIHTQLPMRRHRCSTGVITLWKFHLLHTLVRRLLILVVNARARSHCVEQTVSLVLMAIATTTMASTCCHSISLHAACKHARLCAAAHFFGLVRTRRTTTTQMQAGRNPKMCVTGL